MLIQNISSAAQVAQPVALLSNGASTVAVVNTNNASPPEPSSEQLKGAVNSLNLVMQQSNISLAFSVDSSTHTPVVSVTDSANGEVVAQFPSKATLAIAQAIDQFERMQGLLLNRKA